MKWAEKLGAENSNNFLSFDISGKSGVDNTFSTISTFVVPHHVTGASKFCLTLYNCFSGPNAPMDEK